MCACGSILLQVRVPVFAVELHHVSQTSHQGHIPSVSGRREVQHKKLVFIRVNYERRDNSDDRLGWIREPN